MGIENITQVSTKVYTSTTNLSWSSLKNALRPGSPTENISISDYIRNTDKTLPPQNIIVPDAVENIAISSTRQNLEISDFVNTVKSIEYIHTGISTNLDLNNYPTIGLDLTDPNTPPGAQEGNLSRNVPKTISIGGTIHGLDNNQDTYALKLSGEMYNLTLNVNGDIYGERGLPSGVSSPSLNEKVSFSQVGTTNWTVPTGITNLVRVVAIGAGGGGASGNHLTGESRAGQGGGGGALAYAENVAVQPGDTIRIIIGSGGAEGIYSSAPASGANGGNTRIIHINSSGVETVIAEAGGGSGGRIGSMNGGSGGSVITGQGGSGGQGGGGSTRSSNNANFDSGGGGGAGGYNGNGGNGGFGIGTGSAGATNSGAAGGGAGNDGWPAGWGGGGTGVFGKGLTGSSSSSIGLPGSNGSTGGTDRYLNEITYDWTGTAGGAYGGGGSGGGNPDKTWTYDFGRFTRGGKGADGGAGIEYVKISSNQSTISWNSSSGGSALYLNNKSAINTDSSIVNINFSGNGKIWAGGAGGSNGADGENGAAASCTEFQITEIIKHYGWDSGESFQMTVSNHWSGGQSTWRQNSNTGARVVTGILFALEGSRPGVSCRSNTTLPNNYRTVANWMWAYPRPGTNRTYRSSGGTFDANNAQYSANYSLSQGFHTRAQWGMNKNATVNPTAQGSAIGAGKRDSTDAHIIGCGGVFTSAVSPPAGGIGGTGGYGRGYSNKDSPNTVLNGNPGTAGQVAICNGSIISQGNPGSSGTSGSEWGENNSSSRGGYWISGKKYQILSSYNGATKGGRNVL